MSADASAGRSAPATFTGTVAGQRLELPAGAMFQDAVVVDCDLSRQRIPRLSVSATLFERCDFSRSQVVGVLGVRPWATYRDCTFVRTDLRGAAPSLARFERCTFDNAKLDKWFATSAEFVDCRFSGPLRSMRFAGSVWPAEVAQKLGPRRLEFVGNDFSEAELVDVDFVGGVDIGAQRWPSSPDYAIIEDLPDGLAAAEQEIARWQDGKERSDALEMLRWMQGVYAGQSGTVRRRGQLSPTTERVWSIVEDGSKAARGR